jgi:selenocysteine lyase/cysteine desulfurase
MTTLPALDLAFTRAQFPAFSDPDLAGWRHFENAGGSYAAAQSIDALTRYYTKTKLQPYGQAGPTAAAGNAMDDARTRWAEAMNVTPDEVVFGPSTSQNTYVLAQAFGAMLDAGDEVIVTQQDHEANSGAWRRMADERGFTLRDWTADPVTGRLDPADFDALLSERTRLVCFPHCSNIAGEENPVDDLTAKARAVGAYSVVDGVSWAPHEIADADALGADVYMFSLYKVYGVHQGIMTVRRPLLERLPNQNHFFNGDYLSKKLAPAGPDHAQVAASAGTLDYIEALAEHHGIAANDLGGRTRAIGAMWRTQEIAVAAPLLAFLADHPRARLIGPETCDARRAPTIAFLPEKMTPQALEKALADRGFIVGASDFYAYRLIEALGIDPATGVVRASMTHYSSAEDVSSLIGALEDLL